MKSKAKNRFFLSVIVWLFTILTLFFGLAFVLSFRCISNVPRIIIFIIIGILLLYVGILVLLPKAKQLKYEATLLHKGEQINLKLCSGAQITEDESFTLENANILYDELYNKD